MLLVKIKCHTLYGHSWKQEIFLKRCINFTPNIMDFLKTFERPWPPSRFSPFFRRCLWNFLVNQINPHFHELTLISTIYFWHVCCASYGVLKHLWIVVKGHPRHSQNSCKSIFHESLLTKRPGSINEARIWITSKAKVIFQKAEFYISTCDKGKIPNTWWTNNPR